MRFRSLRAAAYALVLGTSLCASAQTCPKPTVSECVDESYRSGACFPNYKSYCESLIDTEWETQVGKLPQVQRLLPDELGGSVAAVGSLAPVQPTTSNFAGLTTQVSGLVSANQILHRKNFQNLSQAEAQHAKALKEWEGNGTLIRSCREYVHEKYLGYSTFEAKAGVHGADFRALLNHAFSNDGIANRTLYGSDQKPLAPIFDGKVKAPKSAYFLFQPGPYPSGQLPYEFKSDAAAKANNPTARSFYAVTDSWHAQMSKQLVKEADDVLDELRVKQRDFEDLLAERQGIWDSYQAVVKQAKNPEVLAKQVAQDLRTADARIEAALIKAEQDGCLDAQAVTRCDWSPRLYKDMVSRVMDQRRQQDLTQCLQLTADDFSDTSFVRNALLLKLPGLKLKDYTLSPSLLAEYLAIYWEYIGGLGEPKDPSTGTTRRGGTYSDGGEFGDRSTFGGALNYGGEWSATWGSRFCDAELRFGGHATASAWVFGAGGEVAHVEGFLETDNNDIHMFILARLGGSEVYRNDTRAPAFLDFQVANPTFVDGTVGEATGTFWIAFIPVTVSGGISANIGVEFRLGGQVSRDCSMDMVGIDLTGSMKPYTGVSGFASVAVGIPGFRAGIRGSVLIARVDVPLRGSAGIYLSSTSELILRLRLSLAIRQRYLDGRISLFGELGPCPFCIRGEVTIVSWSGFGGPEVPIFNESVDVPLTRL
ncbi:MAG: hypothetical protein JXB05_06610 [Myxococcaceae bacterium]|nr:hypothetical protein [Myxococcaceae bacterium]